MTALLLLALAAPPDGARVYRILLDGQEDGAAQLTVHARPDGGLAYAWRSQIGLSQKPCLRSEQRDEGTFRPGSGQAVPDSLAPSLHALHPGERALLGRDGLPDRVELPAQGLVYVAVAGPPRWDECWPHGLSAGLPLVLPPDFPGARRLTRAVFVVGGRTVESERGRGELMEPLADLLDRAHEGAVGRDCKDVARDLAEELRRLGLDARVEGGLLLDRGRLWPHAWTRVSFQNGHWDLDATTGSDLADAGRIDLGPLEGPGEARTGLAMLAALRAGVVLRSFEP